MRIKKMCGYLWRYIFKVERMFGIPRFRSKEFFFSNDKMVTDVFYWGFS
jgi:hypothetical protein